MISGLIALALALLFALDALSTRGHLDRLQTIRPQPRPDDADDAGRCVLITAPEVTLTEAQRAGAVALMEMEGWSALHLVPGRMAALPAWSVIRALSPRKLSEAPLDPGSTAGHAVIVTEDLWRRAQPEAPAEDHAAPDLPAFIATARSLKGFADPPGALGAAIVPGLAGTNPLAGRAALRALMGPTERVALWAAPIIWLLLAFSLWASPTLGLVALIALHAQIPAALYGGPIQIEGLWISALLRLPLEIGQWAQWIMGKPYLPGQSPVEAARPIYRELLAEGTGRFFEARRDRCPMCESRDLHPHVEVGDLYQSKPGTFQLDRCGRCGHVFQNPALSEAGLSFYYRDFYDGIGGRTLESLFAAGFQPYVDRAQMVIAHLGGEDAPRWLDVGCGHGHFCAHVRRLLPKATLHGLDLGPAVEEAARRRWVARGIQGLLPDLAPNLAGQYDVISMSHYLEHTPDPRAALSGAATALRPGGLLFVEVPDPECPMARRLGRWWMPWLQPQHLHLMPASVLESRLTEAGFAVMAHGFTEAHVPNDLTMAVVLLGSRLAPRLDVPWRPAPSTLEVLRHGAIWLALLPVLGLAMGLDRVLKGWATGGRHGNAYRMVAVRMAGGDGGGDSA